MTGIGVGIAEVSDDSEAGGSGVEEAASEDHAETQPPGPSDALRDFHRTLRPAKGVRPLGASTGRFLVLHETHDKHEASQAPATCVMATQCNHTFARILYVKKADWCVRIIVGTSQLQRGIQPHHGRPKTLLRLFRGSSPCYAPSMMVE